MQLATFVFVALAMVCVQAQGFAGWLPPFRSPRLYVKRAEQCREHPDLPVVFSNVTYNPVLLGSRDRKFSAVYEVKEPLGEGIPEYNSQLIAGLFRLTVSSCAVPEAEPQPRHGQECTQDTDYPLEIKVCEPRGVLNSGRDAPLARAWQPENGCFQNNGTYQLTDVSITLRSLPPLRQRYDALELTYKYFTPTGKLYLCLHVHADRKR